MRFDLKTKNQTVSDSFSPLHHLSIAAAAVRKRHRSLGRVCWQTKLVHYNILDLVTVPTLRWDAEASFAELRWEAPS